MTNITLPLTSDAGLTLSGPHRFLTIRERTGLHVQTINPCAQITTDAHRAPSGTLSLWCSPLEDLGTMPENGHINSKDPAAQWYPLEFVSTCGGCDRYQRTWANKRIGLATSNSVFGPWKRRDTPLFDPRPDCWDSIANTNPAACILPDGRTTFIYKSRSETGGRLQLGMARADHFEGPYQRVGNRPLFVFDDPDQHVEDPYLWHEGGKYHLIMKDMTGGIAGEKHAAIYATSEDAEHWEFAKPAKAYSREVRWDDGTTVLQGSLERPQLLMQNGVPTHLFTATADEPGGFHGMTKSWNMVLPLA